MAKTLSTMQDLGQKAHTFNLPNVAAQNALTCLSDFNGQPVLLMFICNHCPYVIHLAQEMVGLANKFKGKGFAVVAISSNDIENYPQDAPDKMLEFAEQYGFEFPYCYDESQQTAKAYGAACTPDFFVYDAQHLLRYRGQFDASRPGNNIEVTGAELRLALQAVLVDGKTVNQNQRPSLGCSIKWKEGNEAV